MASLAGDGTALGHIARRRGSPDVALRWVSPDGGTEDWSYARVWAAAIFAARKMPPRPEASKDDGAPWCVGLMVQEGPMLAVMELAVILAGYALVPLSPSDPPVRIGFICRDCTISPLLLLSTRPLPCG